METTSLWKCLFLLLCSQTCALGCRWIANGYNIVSRDALSLINKMGGEIVVDTGDVRFPQPLYNRARKMSMEHKIAFVNENFRHLLHLYAGNLDSVTWDRSLLNKFTEVLHRQAREMRSCAGTKQAPKKQHKKLQAYFKKLEKSILKKTKYSADAWEIVRHHVIRHLQELNRLANLMRKEMQKL
uniref:IFNe1 n=1 Tax=Lepisosteus oculatus TaxID=7918 RepID=A0A5P9K5D3_LEPOC|nr:IFNe1 [Lepisosteus oculatus]